MESCDTDCSGKDFGLLQLPRELIDKIFSYLSYDNISMCRPTCKAFNALASAYLNQGFTQADKLHALVLREVKAKLPRRESERRSHPLARHVDILSAVETRLSLLSMTYSKYIEAGLSCFIPGKVLDEIYRVLKLVRTSQNPPRAHELLQELRDISSMAMEHFDDKVAVRLKTQIPSASTLSRLTCILSAGSSSTNTAAAASHSSPFKFTGIPTYTALPVNSPQATPQRQRRQPVHDLRKMMRKRLAQMRGHIAARDAQIAEMSQKIAEQDRKIAEQDRTFAELNRRVVEYDQRFDDVLAEIARVHATAGKSEARVMDANCSQKTERLADSSTARSCSVIVSQQRDTVSINTDTELSAVSGPGSGVDHVYHTRQLKMRKRALGGGETLTSVQTSLDKSVVGQTKPVRRMLDADCSPAKSMMGKTRGSKRLLEPPQVEAPKKKQCGGHGRGRPRS